MAAGETAKELKNLGMIINEVYKCLNLTNVPTAKPILCMDNTAVKAFITKPSVNISKNYIDLDYHFVRDYYESGEFEIKHVAPKQNLADIIAKSLSKDPFQRIRSQLLK